MSRLSLFGAAAMLKHKLNDLDDVDEHDLGDDVPPPAKPKATPAPVSKPIPGEEIAAELARQYGQHVYELLADLLIIERREYREAFKIAA